jgi:triosephosphate isomerase
MRKKIVAGNWKMNGDYSSTIQLYKEIAAKSASFPDHVEVMIAPPFVFLHDLLGLKKNSPGILAQNCAAFEEGAYTGEVSVSMLRSIGINASIVGHSERRDVFGESIDDITQKVALLLKHDMRVVFCIGEQLSDRKAGTYFSVISKQLASIMGLETKKLNNIVIAYEPVWAIGTGETASPEQAQEMHAFIRNTIREAYGSSIADKIAILYGGSVKPSNAAELFSQADVDGGLVGGASLNADDFQKIIEAAS